MNDMELQKNMMKRNLLDICELQNPESLTRRIFQKNGLINLDDYPVDFWMIPKDCVVDKFRLNHNYTPGEIYDHTEPIRQELMNKGFAHKLHLGIYEAITNAHCHAHNKDPNKQITLAYRITPNIADTFIADEGGRGINSNFIPFLLEKKKSENKTKMLPFYEFSKIKDYDSDEHSGNGINTMNLVADEVKYYVNDNGGLVVHLRLNKKRDKQIPLQLKI